MVDLKVDIDLTQWQKVVAKMGNQDLSKPMKKVATYLEAQTKLNFIKERDPVTGKKWEPLSPFTVVNKRSGKMLVETGVLINSFSTWSDQESATIFNPTFYAGFLQAGTRKMPARPYLGLSEQNSNDVTQVIVDALLL
ncbi:MAG: phage virion morphogenesis protein [Moorea sp. SIO4A3]|nr:phage virion morphogenesis protein [Moorena sp. SIO4A3]